MCAYNLVNEAKQIYVSAQAWYTNNGNLCFLFSPWQAASFSGGATARKNWSALYPKVESRYKTKHLP